MAKKSVSGPESVKTDHVGDTVFELQTPDFAWMFKEGYLVKPLYIADISTCSV